MITLAGSNTFAFADGNAGHSCNLGSAPAVGDLDVLCVNSDTVVSTPPGFSVATSRVANQGAYQFYRFAVGGESSTVTVTTTGDFNTQVSWSRWSFAEAFDIAANAGADASAGSTTPAVSTGTLAGTNELVVAFGAIHGATTSNPVWSAGYTPLTSVTQGSGGSTVTGYVAYRTDAGTAAETPNVSWTTPAFERYILAAAFTPVAIVQKSDSDTATATEATALSAGLTATDTGSGTDAPALSAGLSAADTATAVETQTLAAALTSTDTAAAAEAITLAAALATTDTGTALDTVTSLSTSSQTAARGTPRLVGTGSLVRTR